MNTRERFVRTMRFQAVDRVPNFELGAWGQATERWLAEGMPTDVDTNFGVHLGNEFFGFDRWETIPVHMGMVPGFEQVTLFEDDEIIVYISGEGIKQKALKEGTVRGTRPSMDQYLEFPVKTRSDFLDMKKRYDSSARIRYPQWWADYVRCRTGRDYPLCLIPNGTFGLYSMLRRWMGTDAACLVFYDDPAFAEEMLDFLVQFLIETTARAIQDVDVDYFNYFEDFAGKGGPLVSPRLFKKFLLPRYRQIADYLRGHGVDIIQLDSDGYPEVLYPLMIEAGVNCVWPVERAAGMDPLEVRRKYGKDLALCGGIDKREVARGREAIEGELFRLAPLMEEGGFIPELDHTFPPDISYENFLYYLEVKGKLIEGRYGAS